MNGHDPLVMAALFADDYQSFQPVHPGRGFGGSAQVLKNWSSVFEGVPDFHAELVASSVDGDVEWSEWDWRGHHADGSAFAIRGVTIWTVRTGLVADMRLYLEPVDTSDEDIDEAVRTLYGPPTTEPGEDTRGA